MPVERTTIRGARAALALLLLLLILPALLMLGCSTQKNYKTLSFFFDGVPDPNAPPSVLVKGSVTGGPAVPAAAKKFQHQPFAQKKCETCHTADQKHLTSLAAPDLCLKCHPQVEQQYAVMHGPVATGQCLWCHDVHQSDQEHLLKTTGADLCLQCHDRQLLPMDIIGHQSQEAVCLKCHTGHGSNQPSLLRPQTPAVSPPHPPEALPAPDAGGKP